VVADPHGAAFFLFHGNTSAPPRMDPAVAGMVSWQELRAGSLEEAWKFYEGMFGWHKSQAFDMGPMGVYQTFSTNTVQPMTGGMMTKPEGSEARWGFSFTVPAIGEAVERVQAGGGTVRMGPEQVPGGRWTAQCVDPQGNSFGLLAER
jgi:predicted enzyme related to lactoylglutathione lyase